MMKIRNVLAPALVLCAGLATGARAQGTLPIAIEARGGVAIPVSDFGDQTSTGWSVGANVQYPIGRVLGVYGGYEHYSFGVDSVSSDDSGLDAKVADDGFRVGLRASLPLAAASRITPYVEGGLLINRARLSVTDGTSSISIHSNWSAGFEVGAGVAIPLSPRFDLTPGVRFREHRADFNDDSGDTSGSLTADYVSVDIGVRFHP
jgi:opacity protein-like surface antigen